MCHIHHPLDPVSYPTFLYDFVVAKSFNLDSQIDLLPTVI